MTEPQIQQFASFLAGISDEDERRRALAAAKMLAVKAAPEEAFEPPIQPLGPYLATEIPVPPILVEPCIVVRGGLNVVVGRAGKGKTTMSLNRSLRWAAGMPMFDDWKDPDTAVDFLKPVQPLRILIVENEGAAGMFQKQIGTMLHRTEFIPRSLRDQVKENILIWGNGGYSGLKLDDPAKLNGLRAGVEKWKPDIVFIEPFRSLWSGEENSSTEMNNVVDALVGLGTDYDCGVIMSHHESKGAGGYEEKMSAARGSTVLEGIVTTMENFEPAVGNQFRELTFSKIRYQDPDKPSPTVVRMEWVRDAWWYRHVPMSEIEERIIKVLSENNGEPMGVGEMAEATDEKEHKLRKIANQMVEDKRLMAAQSVPRADGRGSTGKRYRLPSEDSMAGFQGADI